MSDNEIGFRIEPLCREHDRAAFSCGVDALDRYLREQANQDTHKHAAVTFVMVTSDNRIAGYYTLSAASINADDMPPELLKQLNPPRYPILPATLIGRLARDVSFPGVGELLLMDALKRAWQNITQVASFAVIVDAKDEHAQRFYAGYGFLSLPDTPKRLFLPMRTIEKLFS